MKKQDGRRKAKTTKGSDAKAKKPVKKAAAANDDWGMWESMGGGSSPPMQTASSTEGAVPASASAEPVITPTSDKKAPAGASRTKKQKDAKIKEFSSIDDLERLQTCTELLGALTSAGDGRDLAGDDLALFVRAIGYTSLKSYSIVETLSTAVGDVEHDGACSGGLLGFERLFLGLGPWFESYAVLGIPDALLRLSHSSPEVREAATSLLCTVASNLNSFAVPRAFAFALQGLQSEEPRVVLGSVTFIRSLALHAPSKLPSSLFILLSRLLDRVCGPAPQALTGCGGASSQEVRATLTALCCPEAVSCDVLDIGPVLPSLVEALLRPDQTPLAVEAVTQGLGCTLSEGGRVGAGVLSVLGVVAQICLKDVDPVGGGGGVGAGVMVGATMLHRLASRCDGGNKAVKNVALALLPALLTANDELERRNRLGGGGSAAEEGGEGVESSERQEEEEGDADSAALSSAIAEVEKALDALNKIASDEE